MKKKKIHNIPEKAGFRGYLRKNLTPAEAYLWRHLKARKLEGRRFIRQHGIGPFIVDFYCASEKLIIELDGEVHNTSESVEYDHKRTQYLNVLGYEVLRIENHRVFDHLQTVLDEIKNQFNTQAPPFS